MKTVLWLSILLFVISPSLGDCLCGDSVEIDEGRNVYVEKSNLSDFVTFVDMTLNRLNSFKLRVSHRSFEGLLKASPITSLAFENEEKITKVSLFVKLLNIATTKITFTREKFAEEGYYTYSAHIVELETQFNSSPNEYMRQLNVANVEDSFLGVCQFLSIFFTSIIKQKLDFDILEKVTKKLENGKETCEIPTEHLKYMLRPSLIQSLVSFASEHAEIIDETLYPKQHPKISIDTVKKEQASPTKEEKSELINNEQVEVTQGVVSFVQKELVEELIDEEKQAIVESVSPLKRMDSGIKEDLPNVQVQATLKLENDLDLIRKASIDSAIEESIISDIQANLSNSASEDLNDSSEKLIFQKVDNTAVEEAIKEIETTKQEQSSQQQADKRPNKKLVSILKKLVKDTITQRKKEEEKEVAEALEKFSENLSKNEQIEAKEAAQIIEQMNQRQEDLDSRQAAPIDIAILQAQTVKPVSQTTGKVQFVRTAPLEVKEVYAKNLLLECPYKTQDGNETKAACKVSDLPPKEDDNKIIVEKSSQVIIKEMMEEDARLLFSRPHSDCEVLTGPPRFFIMTEIKERKSRVEFSSSASTLPTIEFLDKPSDNDIKIVYDSEERVWMKNEVSRGNVLKRINNFSTKLSLTQAQITDLQNWLVDTVVIMHEEFPDARMIVYSDYSLFVSSKTVDRKVIEAKLKQVLTKNTEENATIVVNVVNNVEYHYLVTQSRRVLIKKRPITTKGNDFIQSEVEKLIHKRRV